MSYADIFAAAGLICFVLAAFGVESKVNLFPAGAAFCVVAYFLS